jgi:hypothetical protein
MSEIVSPSGLQMLPLIVGALEDTSTDADETVSEIPDVELVEDDATDEGDAKP